MFTKNYWVILSDKLKDLRTIDIFTDKSTLLINLDFWCGQRDSNSHTKIPLGPQPSLSTNFSMTAWKICDRIN